MPFNIQILKRGHRITALANTWHRAVLANGGTVSNNSLHIVNNFTMQLATKSYAGKIVYLLPMVGTGLAAAVVPLIDIKSAGKAANTSFTNGDFSEITGLQGNGSSKILTISLNPAQFGIGNNGGIGWWENNINFGGTETEVAGYTSNDATQRFTIDLRATLKFFCWGAPVNAALDITAATNGHYYGQRTSSTNREFYQDGSQLATNSSSDTASHANEQNTLLMGANDSGTVTFWAGRCALAYFTDGTLSSGEATDLDSLLRAYLMNASGKPTS